MGESCRKIVKDRLEGTIKKDYTRKEYTTMINGE